MTTGDSPQISTGVLARELTLFEYGTCSDLIQANLLYEHRQDLRPFLDRRWLMQFFDGDKPSIRADHFVGVLPFQVHGTSHLLLIAPKGCAEDNRLGLVRFLELLAFQENGSPLVDISGWEGLLGPHRFLLFLARNYASLLKELCQRDFRSYYRAIEGDVRAFVRGRLNLPAYARNIAQGKGHVLPCRWDEFTVDNWDNRILWAAAKRLRDVATVLDAEAAAPVWGPFQHLLSWFSPVTEIPITSADFRRSRLGRTSRYYQRALTWARLLLQGSDLPAANGRVPPIVLDTAPAFENFARVTVQAALPNSSWRLDSRKPWPFLTGQHAQDRIPDFLVTNTHGMRAVGDAKYKDILEESAGVPLRTGKEVRAHIQAADWNQLYVYMRAKSASCGFFVVPFWNAGGPPIDWLDDLGFSVSPCDRTVRVAVLALNLLQPLWHVKQAAAERLGAWISD